MQPKPLREKTRQVLFLAMRDITGRGLFADAEVSRACEAVEILAQGALTHALETGGQISAVAAIDGVGMRKRAVRDPVSLAENFLNMGAGSLQEKAREGFLSYRCQVPGYRDMTPEETIEALADIIAREIVNACAKAGCVRARAVCALSTLEITNTPYVSEWKPLLEGAQGAQAGGPVAGYIVDVPVEGMIGDQGVPVRGIVRAIVPMDGENDLGHARIENLDLFGCDRNGEPRRASHGKSGPAAFILSQLQRFDPDAPGMRQCVVSAAEDVARFHHEKLASPEDPIPGLGNFGP